LVTLPNTLVGGNLFSLNLLRVPTGDILYSDAVSDPVNGAGGVATATAIQSAINGSLGNGLVTVTPIDLTHFIFAPTGNLATADLPPFTGHFSVGQKQTLTFNNFQDGNAFRIIFNGQTISTDLQGGPLTYSATPPVAAAPNKGDKQGWTSGPLPEEAKSPALLSSHRLTFELPAAKDNVWLPWLVRLHGTGNGFLYLNGHAIGRFWQAGKQTDYYLPECWLNSGPGKTNEVTLVLRSVDKPATIESAEVVPYTVYAEQR
jgi:hypothetical protein